MSEQIHIDQNAQDLLNGGIDGELSAAERDELDGLLAGSSQMRDLNEELGTLTSLLDDLPDVEPPQYLQKTIERQISLPVQSNRNGEKPGFFAGWLPAHWLRTGFALAAGAVLTVGIYEMGSTPITAEDANKLAGTMVGSQAAGQGQLLDKIHILTDSLNGRVELHNKDDLFTLDVQLESEGPAHLVVSFAGRGLEYEGITRIQNHENSVSISDSAVNIASSGEQRYRLNLRRTTEVQDREIAPLELEFFANNMLVHKAELRVSQQSID